MSPRGDGTPSRRPDGTPSRRPDGTPSRRPDGTPSRRPDEVFENTLRSQPVHAVLLCFGIWTFLSEIGIVKQRFGAETCRLIGVHKTAVHHFALDQCFIRT